MDVTGRKVFVVSKGFHDWSAAAEHGELVFLSDKPVNRAAVSQMVRTYLPILEKSDPGDYIVISGLSVMCSIACAIFAVKHKRVNFLLYDAQTEKYIRRTFVLPDEQED